MNEAPPVAPPDLVAAYELLRQGRRAAGRHTYALLITRGLAEWLHSATDLVPPVATTPPSHPAGPGVGPSPGAALPPGIVQAVGLILAGALTDPQPTGGAA